MAQMRRLEFIGAAAAAIAGTPRIENGGPFAVDFANGRRDGITLSSGMRLKIFGVQFADGRRGWCATMVHDPQCRACRRSRQNPREGSGYSGFGLKSQTPARKSAQLSRAPARAAGCRRNDQSLTRPPTDQVVRQPSGCLHGQARDESLFAAPARRVH